MISLLEGAPVPHSPNEGSCSHAGRDGGRGSKRLLACPAAWPWEPEVVSWVGNHLEKNCVEKAARRGKIRGWLRALIRYLRSISP